MEPGRDEGVWRAPARLRWVWGNPGFWGMGLKPCQAGGKGGSPVKGEG